MFDVLKRFFATPPSYDHWDAPEIWRESPPSSLKAAKGSKRKRYWGEFNRYL